MSEAEELELALALLALDAPAPTPTSPAAPTPAPPPAYDPRGGRRFGLPIPRDDKGKITTPLAMLLEAARDKMRPAGNTNLSRKEAAEYELRNNLR